MLTRIAESGTFVWNTRRRRGAGEKGGADVSTHYSARTYENQRNSIDFQIPNFL